MLQVGSVRVLVRPDCLCRDASPLGAGGYSASIRMYIDDLVQIRKDLDRTMPEQALDPALPAASCATTASCCLMLQPLHSLLHAATTATTALTATSTTSAITASC